MYEWIVEVEYVDTDGTTSWSEGGASNNFAQALETAARLAARHNAPTRVVSARHERVVFCLNPQNI